jgi:hypothetical protein
MVSLPMRYINDITDKQRQDLAKIHKESKSYQERNRCQCILLSIKAIRYRS